GARYNGVAAGDVDPLIAPAHLNWNEWTSFPNREDWLVACNINPPLRIALHPTGGTFDSGQNWTGTASVIAGEGNRTFRWYVYDDQAQSIGAGPNVLRLERLDVPYVYTDSDTYSIYYLTHAEDNHRYVFRAIDTYWIRTSIPFDIAVNDVPLVVTISPGGTTASGSIWTWTGSITGGTLKPVDAVFSFDNDPVLGDGYAARLTVAWTADTGWDAGYDAFTLDPTDASHTGYWRLQYNDTGGAHDSADSYLTVTGCPDYVTVTAQPVGGVYYAGQSHTFTIAATSTAPPETYTWLKYDAGVWTDTGWGDVTAHTLDPLDVADAGNYRCRVDAGCSWTNSVTVTLTVDPPMSIATQPVGGSIIEGGQYTFQVAVADTHGTVTYAWSRDGVAISGQEWATCVIDPVTLADEGSYTCTVTDDSGPLQTAPAFLDVIPLPPVPLSGLAALTLLLSAFAIVRLRRRADR
ncbi:MAG: peptidyl-prolyl cis-trans isomerase, partial [Candidatus Hydrogenedentes bacterium]|nr:peptidyl-prolyl cis-trans isomerase [Candidatus Hydrogenedentota bacterium]